MFGASTWSRPVNYDQVVSTLQTMLEVPLNNEDSNFTRILPTMFAYADGRIYRELDFLITTISLESKLTARKRDVQLPPSVLVLRQVNVCTPATLAVGPTSRRHTLERVTPEALDMFWPQASFQPALPRMYAIVGSAPVATALIAPMAQPVPPVFPSQVTNMAHIVRFMPTPDQAYPVEFLGVI